VSKAAAPVTFQTVFSHVVPLRKPDQRAPDARGGSPLLSCYRTHVPSPQAKLASAARSDRATLLDRAEGSTHSLTFLTCCQAWPASVVSAAARPPGAGSARFRRRGGRPGPRLTGSSPSAGIGTSCAHLDAPVAAWPGSVTVSPIAKPASLKQRTDDEAESEPADLRTATRKLSDGVHHVRLM
jgi:hypothetical protein